MQVQTTEGRSTAGAKTTLSNGLIVVMQQAGQVGLASLPARLHSNHEIRHMARAIQAYLPDNSPAMTRRTLFALIAAILYREPIPPPLPITCLRLGELVRAMRQLSMVR